MAGDGTHGFEHALVANVAAEQLCIDHPLAGNFLLVRHQILATAELAGESTAGGLVVRWPARLLLLPIIGLSTLWLDELW